MPVEGNEGVISNNRILAIGFIVDGYISLMSGLPIVPLNLDVQILSARSVLIMQAGLGWWFIVLVVHFLNLTLKLSLKVWWLLRAFSVQRCLMQYVSIAGFGLMNLILIKRWFIAARLRYWDLCRRQVKLACDIWHLLGLPDVTHSTGYHAHRLGIIWRISATCLCLHPKR